MTSGARTTYFVTVGALGVYVMSAAVGLGGAHQTLLAVPNLFTTTTLLVLAVVALLAVPRYPAVGVWVYLALAHGVPRYSPIFAFILDLRLLEAVAILAVWGALLSRRPTVAWRERLMLLLGLFIAWIAIAFVVSSLAGGIPTLALYRRPIRYLDAYLLAIAAAIVLDTREAFSATVVILAGVLAAHAAVFPASIYRDNDYAALVAIALPLLAGVGFTERGMTRGAAGLLLLITAYSLFLTQNRGAALAVVAAIGVLWITAKRAWLWLIPIAVAGGTSFLWFSRTAYWQRFVGLLKAGPDNWTNDGRVQLWRAAWDLAKVHPWFGVGPGRFALEANQVASGLDQPAHNNFLSVLVEFGWIGLVLYSSLFGWAFYVCWCVGRSGAGTWPSQATRFLAAALAAYLVIGLFLTRQDLALAYVIVGTVAGWNFASRRFPPSVSPVTGG